MSEIKILRQLVLQPNGTRAKVQIVTGDTMRHGLREASSYMLLEAAGLLDQKLTEEALRLLFSGGMVTGSSGSGVKLDERYKFDTYTQHVLKWGQTTKQYEDEAKRRFIQEPANLKLLIVVSKLLTGFDAPSCTYIYLDSELQDHALFQAICRTNRLDGDDKDYGHIVDFKELFGEVKEAIAVYTSAELATDPASGRDDNVHLKKRLEEGRRKLDEAQEALHYLCEPVPLPREVEQFLRYFCGDAADPNALSRSRPS